MKQRRVGEHAIKTATRQVELEEILLPYFAAAVGARHRGAVRGALQTNRDMTAFGKRLEVASGPAAEIEYHEGWFALNESQQRRDILADVVIARPFPKLLGTPVVVFQREVGDFFQILLIQFHALHPRQAAGERKGVPVETAAGSFILTVYLSLATSCNEPPDRSNCFQIWSGLALASRCPVPSKRLPSRPGEFHPEAPHRSGREPLDSSGSCHRAKAAAFR